MSPDPQFIDKLRDIVGLYLNPPDAALVLCVDEKTQVQSLKQTAPVCTSYSTTCPPTTPRPCNAG